MFSLWCVNVISECHQHSYLFFVYLRQASVVGALCCSKGQPWWLLVVTGGPSTFGAHTTPLILPRTTITPDLLLITFFHAHMQHDTTSLKPFHCVCCRPPVVLTPCSRVSSCLQRGWLNVAS